MKVGLSVYGSLTLLLQHTDQGFKLFLAQSSLLLTVLLSQTAVDYMLSQIDFFLHLAFHVKGERHCTIAISFSKLH